MDLISIGLLSPVAGIIGITMGIYVYEKSPTLPTSKVFLLSMVLFLIGAFLDFALLYASTDEMALLMAKAMLFDVVLLFASILYLASFLPYERTSGWFQGKEVWLAGVALLSAFVSVIPADSVSYSSQGWSVDSSLAFVLWTGIVVIYIAITIFMVHRTCKGVKWERTRKQGRWLSMGVASPALYAFFIQGLSSIDINLPFTLSPGFLVLAIVLAYGILRYRLFLPPAAKESGVKGKRAFKQEITLDQNLLLLEEERPAGSYQLLLNMLAQGRIGLIITRSHPDMVREEYKLERTPVLWLAKQPGPGRIDPSNLMIMKQIIIEYLHQGEKAAVVLDGLEYLMHNNPPERVMVMLNDVCDAMVASGSTMVLSVDPKTMEPRYLALLEREFKLVAAA